jgi:hypothetical protein
MAELTDLTELVSSTTSTTSNELSPEKVESIIKLSKEILNNKLDQDRIRYKGVMPEQGYILNFKFPIKELDNIPVTVTLILYEKDYKTISLKIESSKIYISNDFDFDENGPENVEKYIYNNEEILKDDDPKYTIEFIQEALTIINHKLSNIRFNKYYGKFSYKTYETYETPSFEDWKNYLNMSEVKLEFNECCVCLEMTTTKTHCNHSLCYYCWSKLNYSESEEINEETLKCPYCRDDISF